MGYPGEPGQLRDPRRAGRVRDALVVSAPHRPGGIGHGAGVPQRPGSLCRADLRGGGDQPDPARHGGRQPAVRLPRLPRQARRGARTAEYVAVLRNLWTQEVSEFSGEFYRVPRGRMAPRPVQPGGPPVLLGGMARPALQRIGRIADGWLTSSRTDLSRIGDGIGVVRESAAAAGRDPATLRIICRGVVRAGAPVTTPGGSGRLLLSGTADQIREDTAWLSERGVTELFYDLNWDPLVGAPDIDPASAAARAGELLEA